MVEPPLRTDRLVLRTWLDSDHEPFAKMNADPDVMEFFPDRLTGAQSNALIGRFQERQATLGFCPWAVELRASGEFIGFIGLNPVPNNLPFAPAIEVGWRLARAHWGKGYATEGGHASMRFGFDELGLEEIVSMTAVVNERSCRVMERLGMEHDPAEDFEHPNVLEGHPLRPHVLYRLPRDTAATAPR